MASTSNQSPSSPYGLSFTQRDGMQREGFQWTPSAGLQQGLPSLGIISPATNFQSHLKPVDVAVIGAGYAGLTAARDLALSGHNVLLLEARSRIGGRTWTSHIDGYPFEMGGTWVHWGQPHVWREISRYGLKRELELSPQYSSGLNTYSIITPRYQTTMSHDDEGLMFENAFKVFVNVDGQFGRVIMPNPHDPYLNPDVAKYDRMSIMDRFAQIENELSAVERDSLEDFCCCAAAAQERTLGIMDTCITWKFRNGQSSFALNFFNEALRTGRLAYAFNAPITKVDQTKGAVGITLKDGRRFQAARVVCTIPLNVLPTINFEPAFEKKKADAYANPHVNQCVKVHAEVSNRELRSWSAVTYPHNELIYGIGDGTTQAGNTHLVFFGAEARHLQPEDDMEKTVAAIHAFGNMDIRRVVFHNWSRDEYAKGAWCFFRPGTACGHMVAMQERHDRVFFASADWADGWRGFIDGAIEEGAKAAIAVSNDLQAEATAGSKL